MKVIDLTKDHEEICSAFEKKCKELGSHDGWVEVSVHEYNVLLKHYNVRKPFFSWPKINGITVISTPFIK